MSVLEIILLSVAYLWLMVGSIINGRRKKRLVKQLKKNEEDHKTLQKNQYLMNRGIADVAGLSREHSQRLDGLFSFITQNVCPKIEDTATEKNLRLRIRAAEESISTLNLSISHLQSELAETKESLARTLEEKKVLERRVLSADTEGRLWNERRQSSRQEK